MTSFVDALIKRSDDWNVAQRPAARTDDGRVVPLGHNHQLAVATFQVWTAKIPVQYAVADLLVPAFWSKVELALQARTGRPKPGDFIRCIAADGGFDGFFAIQEVSRGYKLVFSHGRLPEQAAS